MATDRTAKPPQHRGASIRLARRLWREHFGPYRVTILWSAALIVLTVLLQIPGPLLTMYVIDSALQTQDLGTVGRLAVAMLALALSRHVFAFVSESLTLRLRESIVQDLCLKMVRHLLLLPLSFFDEHHSSYLQSRLMSDSRAIEGALVRTLVNAMTNVLTFLAGTLWILYLRWELGLFVLGTVLPFAWIRYYANDRMRELSTEMQERQAVTSAAVAESFAGIRTVKVFQLEDMQAERLEKKFFSIRDIYIQTNRFGLLSSVGTSLVTSVSITLVLWFGLRQVVAGTMSFGEVVGILAFLNLLYNPVSSLLAANLDLHRAGAALGRVFALLDQEPEADGGESGLSGHGVVEFSRVSFAYGQGKTVLHEIDLKAQSGEKIAIVGRSGAGKSTLVSCLMGFRYPTTGRLLIDGHEVRSIKLGALRGLVSLVEQETFLFDDSILENIRYGNPRASLDEVLRASEACNARDFIEALPDGFDSRVGERGVRLSGGERQRIALARIVLRQPRILILDEAVSAVDSESELLIQEALSFLLKGRTAFIIAHRLSSLLMADRIVLLEDGRVVEEGTHQQLLATEGKYTTLFHSQFQSQQGNSWSASARQASSR